MEVSIPGRVFDDYLSNMVSDMAEALELPSPRCIKAGNGRRFIYDGLTISQADDVAAYLAERAETLLGQSTADPYDPHEKAERDTHRAALRAAEKIRMALRRS